MNKKVKQGSVVSLTSLIVFAGIFYLTFRVIWRAVSDLDWEISI